jgi:hypothetical protein
MDQGFHGSCTDQDGKECLLETYVGQDGEGGPFDNQNLSDDDLVDSGAKYVHIPRI